MNRKERAIFEELMASPAGKPQLVVKNFIPESLDNKANLASFLTGGNEEEIFAKLTKAFEEARKYMAEHGFDPDSLEVMTNSGKSENHRLSRGGMCFRARRYETQREVEIRVGNMANREYHKELDRQRELKRKQKELAKKQAEVERLAKELGK